MKQRFIRRFIITEKTCTIGVPSVKHEGVYTGFQGNNKSPYKPMFHRIKYLCHTRDEEDAVSLLGYLYRSVKLHRSFVC